MNAEAFLRLIVPADGIRYLGVLQEGSVRPAHYPFQHYDVMANAAEQWDGRNAEVYFALASYNPPVQATDKSGQPLFHPDERPKMLKRTASLAKSVQSFWADLDCGDGKPYATRDDAIVGLNEFIQKTGAPRPVVVNSGGGVHVYWPFETPIAAAQWVGWAKHWRAVLHQNGLHSDPQRDTDVASILRVPGTHNHKHGLLRPVEVLEEAGATPTAQWFAWLLSQAKQVKQGPKRPPAVDFLGEKPAFLADDAEANELAARAGPRHSALEASKHCAQLRYVASVRGDVREPLWRLMLGVVKSSTEGAALAHEWSTGFSGYEHDDTQGKFDRWVGGPATCEKFHELNPSMCDGCPHKGRITSPLQLGVVAVEQQVITVQVNTEEGKQTQQAALPRGYLFDHSSGTMCKQVRSEDGVLENVPFAKTLFHGVTRIRTVDSKFELRLRVYPHGNAPREFTIPTGDIAAGGTELNRMLGQHEVIPTMNKLAPQLRQGFLLDEVVRLQREGMEMVTYDQFGWHENTFLYGDVLYTPEGPVPVLLAEGLRARTEVGPRPEADHVAWAQSIDALYNRPDMEWYQYTVATAFGSVLAGLMGSDYNGCALCLTGITGKGKTTAARMAVSAWGDPSGMTYGQKEGATANARMYRMGAYKSLPVLHDEIGSMSQEEAQILLYSMANGRGRARMDRTGTIEQEPKTWRSHPILTSNKYITELVSDGKGSGTATAVRNFEIDTDAYKRIVLPVNEVDALRAVVEKNAGAAGALFIEHVVTHQAEVRDKLFELQALLIAALPVLESDPKYRLYRMHAQCTLTALVLARKLKLLKFPLRPLFRWVVEHIRELCETVEELDAVEDASLVSRMLADLSGRIVVTDCYHDNRSSAVPEDPKYPLRGPVAGRFVLGTPLMPASETWAAQKLFLATSAVTHWCRENGLRKKDIVEELESKGALLAPVSANGMYSLTRGTPLPPSQVSALFIDAARIDGIETHLAPNEADVQPG